MLSICKDADLLAQALLAEPGNSRYQFYLAQSLRDAGQLEAALGAYLRRADMGGFAEEQWFALYQAAILSERLQQPGAEVCERYLDAFEARPQRAESLVELARFERQRGHWARAYLYAARAWRTPLPAADILFVDSDAYAWRAADELSIAAYWCGHYIESRQLCQALLASTATPALQKPRIQANLDFAQQRIQAKT